VTKQVAAYTTSDVGRTVRSENKHACPKSFASLDSISGLAKPRNRHYPERQESELARAKSNGKDQETGRLRNAGRCTTSSVPAASIQNHWLRVHVFNHSTVGTFEGK
jgi:hypothetical protein